MLFFGKHFDEVLHSKIATDGHLDGRAAAHRTLGALLVHEGVRIYAISADEHEVVVQVGSGARRDLECLVAARC